jgi:anthranilate synthase/aminodeoxychorismate synthase-like glutamine amidotransferase
MIYLIDNYDSFTYNLYQLIGTLSEEPIAVVKSDQITIEDLESVDLTGLVFSPGPGRPEDADNMLIILKHFIGKVPIFGVCLGEQAIGEVYGASVIHAPELMHGRPSKVSITTPSAIFQNCPPAFQAARYHSLIVDPTTIPENLTVTAQTSDGEVMAIADEKNKVYGVQFHPESIMTDPAVGQKIVENFLAVM